MIGVHVRDDDCIQLGIVERFTDVGKRAAAKVEQNGGLWAAHDVARAGAPGAWDRRTRSGYKDAQRRSHAGVAN